MISPAYGQGIAANAQKIVVDGFLAYTRFKETRMRIFFLTTVLALFAGGAMAHDTPCPVGGDFTLAIHGGAGVITKDKMSDEREAEYRDTLQKVLVKGSAMLSEGMQALDVVEAVIEIMENDPKFNAGKGAVFSAAEKNELDASIMDGRDKNAGAVAGVTTVKNPIRLARAVMDKSRHVMLQSAGAETFAKENGLEIVEPDYFYTKRRWNQMQKKKAKQEGFNHYFKDTPETKFGTVGATVRDACGDLAAGTSTGGLTAKKWGRVGDTPIIGAGTYADNGYCAVSATGTGEFFIRGTIARDVCARREFLGESLKKSTHEVIHGDLTEMGGDGGIVAVDNDGNFTFSFNTEGMYRGAVRGNGNTQTFTIKIFKDN